MGTSVSPCLELLKPHAVVVDEGGVRRDEAHGDAALRHLRRHYEPRGPGAHHQGLSLVHHSAQLKPFLTQKHTLNTPNTPYRPLNTPETTPNCTPRHTEGA